MRRQFLGQITVDSGCLMIADPCYWIGEDTGKNDWVKFCDSLSQTQGHTCLSHQEGHSGKGVVLHSGFGDGAYDVVGNFDGRQLISFEIILFKDCEGNND